MGIAIKFQSKNPDYVLGAAPGVDGMSAWEGLAKAINPETGEPYIAQPTIAAMYALLGGDSRAQALAAAASATAAAASEGSVTANAATVTAAAAQVATALSQVQVLIIAALAAGRVKNTITEGLNATPVGEAFGVWGAANGPLVASFYLNNNGVALDLGIQISSYSFQKDILPVMPMVIRDGNRVIFYVYNRADGSFAPITDINGCALTLDMATGKTERVRSRAETDAAIDSRVQVDIVTRTPFDHLPDELQPAFFVGTKASGGGDAIPVVTKYGRIGHRNTRGKIELLPDRPELATMIAAGGGVVTKTLSAANAHSILAWGNSLEELIYSFKNKSAFSNLSGLTHFIWHNGSQRGNDINELYYRFQQDLTQLGEIHPRLLDGWYVLVGDFSNSNWKARDFRDYWTALRRIARLIKSCGGIPVFITEPRSAAESMAFGAGAAPLLISGLSQIAREMGGLFWDISDWNRRSFGTRNAALSQGNHPGQREQDGMTQALLRYVNALPTPGHSPKVFRPRDTAAARDALRFDTLRGRHKLWAEAAVAHTALAADGEAYVDALDLGIPSLQAVNSEYALLAQGGSITFTNRGLVYWTIPGTAHDTQSLVIDFGNAAVTTVYALSADVPLAFNPLPGTGPDSYTVVEFAGDMPNAPAGSTYTWNGDTYTVQGGANVDGRNLIVFTPGLSNGANAVTFALASGTGDATLTVTRLRPGEDIEFYRSLGSPWMTWTPLTVVGGKVTFTSADQASLQKAMCSNRQLALCVEMAGDFAITPTAQWVGVESDRTPERPYEPEPAGAQLIATPRVEQGGWKAIDADGVITGDAVFAAPSIGWLPYGVTQVATVSSTAGLRISVAPAQYADRQPRARFAVQAQYAPPLHGAGVGFSGGDLLTPTSFDYVTLKVRLHNGDPRNAMVWEDFVGLSWGNPFVDFDLPLSMQAIGTLYADIYAVEHPLQIAQATYRQDF